MRVILGKPPRTSSSPLRDQLGWTTLHERRQRFMLTQVHKCLLNLAPPYLTEQVQAQLIPVHWDQWIRKHPPRPA